MSDLHIVKPARDLRNALAKARDEFFESEKGRSICDGTAQGQYLRNRLELAFIAGWTAGEAKAEESSK